MGMVKCKNCEKEISIKTAVCDCGERNEHYAPKESDSIKKHGDIKKYKKCIKGHNINLDQYTNSCHICGEEIIPEIYSLCRGCGNEVLDIELCERCTPGSKCEDKSEDNKSAEPLRAHCPRLECQSNELFNPEIKNGHVIGREGNINTMCLNNIAISGKHASFIEENGKWFIRDEGSKYGTKVKWIPIAPHEKVPLKDGDVICLADEIIFVFKME